MALMATTNNIFHGNESIKMECSSEASSNDKAKCEGTRQRTLDYNQSTTVDHNPKTLRRFSSHTSHTSQVSRQTSHSSISRRSSITNIASDLDFNSIFSPNADNGDQKFSKNASEAIKDFELHVKYWGKDFLDEEVFNTLLDDIDYKRCRNGLFQDFLDEIADANSQFVEEDRAVKITDIQQLYRSEPYQLPEQTIFSSGGVLMTYIDKKIKDMFRDADFDGNNLLNKSELSFFVEDLLGSTHSSEEIDELFVTLDADGDGHVSIEEFKSFILKANAPEMPDTPSNFNEFLLCPSHGSEEDFVTELENYSKNHRAVTHHLLANLASASFGSKSTADLLLRFLSAYSLFNSKFISNLKALIDMLDNEDHKKVLHENLKEEMGNYDEVTLRELEAMGIGRVSVEGISHHDLFKDLIDFVESTLGRSYYKFIPKDIYSPLNQSIGEVSQKGKLGLLAALYFGSELIVPLIYSSILQGLKNSIRMSNEEARFFILHISMDKDHAQALRDIVVENCRHSADRITLVKCTELLLNARVKFYDNLLEYNSSEYEMRDLRTTCDNRPSTLLFSNNDFASHFTGCNTVLEFCKDCVTGATVLEIGCHQGSISRKILGMRAAKIIGIDLSEEMVKVANSHPEKTVKEHYVVGDIVNLMQTIRSTTNKTNLMPGAQFSDGIFDLVIGIYVLNNVTITDMNKMFKDIFGLLKPGGNFIFSVPHPYMANFESELFGFHQIGRDYFALRDRVLDGRMSATDGNSHNVRMYFKTFDDYMNTALKHGFEVVRVMEGRVTPEDMELNRALFESINDKPTYLTVNLCKPDIGVGEASKLMTKLPKKLNWTNAVTKNPSNAFYVYIPSMVDEELRTAATNYYENGIRDIEALPAHYCSSVFPHLKAFASSLRDKILHGNGVAILKGFDLDRFGLENTEKTTICSKMAYFLLCSHIGTIDGSARGKLFDVKNFNIDAMSTKSDNVLFSVSDCEAKWHTDGASKDKVYDAVSLLCIFPGAYGGKSKVSNACNAFDSLKTKLPKFLLHELLRPLPRDILENGHGKGTQSIGAKLSRVESILSLRIIYNCYPIFVTDGDHMRFRYMRHWIETAHSKLMLRIPTLLRIAMDVLDDALDEACCFHQALDRGDILICNNACIAHGRDAFTDVPEKPARHFLRAWMQVQQLDTFKPPRY